MTHPIVREVIARMLPQARIIERDPAAAQAPMVQADSCTPSAQALVAKWGTPAQKAALEHASSARADRVVSVVVEMDDPLLPPRLRRRTVLVDTVSGRIVGSSG